MRRERVFRAGISSQSAEAFVRCIFFERYFVVVFCGEAAADLPSIFEAVRDRLCRSVDSNRDTFNPCVDGALR